MIKKTLDFLARLAQNNNREWFAAHKDEYLSAKSEFEALVSRLIPIVQEIDPSVGHITVPDCTYRIYRDTRFRADKTPYKIHMGAYLNRKGKKSPYAGYYLHLSPAEGSLWGGGLYCPDNELLRAVRWDIYENIDEFLDIHSTLEKDGFHLSEEDMLKKIPQGFPKDFQYAHLLRHRHYDIYRPITDEILRDDDTLIEATREAFRTMMPFNRFMNYTIDESLPNLRALPHSITHRP